MIVSGVSRPKMGRGAGWQPAADWQSATASVSKRISVEWFLTDALNVGCTNLVWPSDRKDE
jgi:hypothetical protein